MIKGELRFDRGFINWIKVNTILLQKCTSITSNIFLHVLTVNNLLLKQLKVAEVYDYSFSAGSGDE